MSKTTPPCNLSVLITDKDVKTKWAALQGTLKYARASLTRKLNQEVELANGSIPDKDATVVDANM